MNPSEEHIKEIAELLDCGEICFFHKLTGEIEHYPDPNRLYFEDEPWQEIMDKISGDLSNYLRFDKMDSRESFQVMEDFANSLADDNFRMQLLKLLSERKPFGKFKYAIDYSQHRQDWFDFKHQEMIKWVRAQLPVFYFRLV